MVDPLTRTVANLLSRFGGDATMIVTEGEGRYDPSTSSTFPVEKEYRVRVVAQNYIQRGSGITSQIGGLIQTGDKQFIIQASDGVPVPRPGVDYLIFEGRKWIVHTLKEYNPSGSKAYAYEVYARQ